MRPEGFFFNLSNVLPGGRRDARRLRETSELTMTCPAVPSPEPGRIDRLIRKWRRGRYAVAASFIAWPIAASRRCVWINGLPHNRNPRAGRYRSVDFKGEGRSGVELERVFCRACDQFSATHFLSGILLQNLEEATRLSTYRATVRAILESLRSNRGLIA
jgi:hypothetical protein